MNSPLGGTVLNPAGTEAPLLRTDDEGFVWLFNASTAGQIDFIRTRSDLFGLTWDSGNDYARATPGRIQTNLPLITLDSLKTSRLAYAFDASFGRLGQQGQEFALRVVYMRRRPDGREYLASMTCTRNTAGLLTICDYSDLTLARPGRQWMPTLSYDPRGGTASAWRLTYLTTDGVNESAGRIRVEGASIDRAGGVSDVLFLRTDLTGSRPYCPRTDGYWGDYFGSAGVLDGGLFFTVTAFSDSSPACGPVSDFISRPLHVVAARY